jgi:hypothetical protein
VPTKCVSGEANSLSGNHVQTDSDAFVYRRATTMLRITAGLESEVRKSCSEDIYVRRRLDISIDVLILDQYDK